MNLYDILRRPDRCAELLAGEASPVRSDGSAPYLGACFQAHAILRLRRASEFRALRTFPRDIGWTIAKDPAERAPAGPGGREAPDSPPRFSIRIREEGGDGREAVLWQHIGDVGGEVRVLLSWPLWAGQVAAFNLELDNAGPQPVTVRNGPVFDPRLALRPLLKGRGVEVGPGLNPYVRPAADVEVTYVEALPIEEWIGNYAKGRQLTEADVALFELYRIGDAQRLDSVPEASLDFIFSNHVFEHLMNPLGVLRNWRSRLAPGGVIAGVVPNPRGCFDLRQPASTAPEWEQEFATDQWTLTPAKYERWCRYTEPRTTPESLMARKYSVHAHYYTPAAFRELAECAERHGFGFDMFLNTSVNAKDFGFALWPRSPGGHAGERSP
jgi:SAM-dependent methyltransferase